MPKVSIIVPSYNVEKFIIKCLKSIQNQSYHNFEVIIVDDSFLDNTKELINKFIKTDNRFRLIDLENNRKYSIGEKRNIGIENAVGEYLCFVDSDDYIDIDMVEKCIEYISNKKTDITIFNIRYVDSDYNEIKKAIIAENNFYVLNTKTNLVENYIKYWLGVAGSGSSFNKIYRASLIRENNIRFSTEINVAEDVLFCAKVMMNCYKIGYMNEIVYNYVRHTRSITNNNKYCELIVPAHCYVYSEIVSLFYGKKVENLDLLKPMLFIILMTQAMALLKSKTEENYQSIENYFDDYFAKSELLKSISKKDVEKSIEYYIANSKVNKYSMNEYIDFLDSIITRNGAIIKRQEAFVTKGK